MSLGIRCPECNNATHVIDSRAHEAGQIMRRRACTVCNARLSTVEAVVVERRGNRQGPLATQAALDRDRLQEELNLLKMELAELHMERIREGLKPKSLPRKRRAKPVDPMKGIVVEVLPYGQVTKKTRFNF